MMRTNFLEDLRAVGVPPESVDLVICTHLHVDHVGWNTRLDNGRWVPTFECPMICGSSPRRDTRPAT